jgi:4-hydroxy-tetrahydrodipicolinate reductase
MGKRIISLCIDAGGFEIIAAIDKNDHPDMGKDAGLIAGAGVINVKMGNNYPAGADTVIDFSGPAGTDKTIDYCVNNGSALVLGTTGLATEQHENIKKASKKIL